MAGYSYTPKTTTAPPIDPAASSPLISTPPPGDSIDNYRSKTNTAWIIVLVVLLVVGIAGVIVLNNLPRPEVTTTPTPPPPTTYSTESRTGGIAFEDATVSGYWRITETVWGTSGVRLTVEVMVDSGVLYYAFYAYASDDLTQHEPVTTSPMDLEPGFAGPGEKVSGTITFELPRQPMTLIMVSRGHNQLSALPVEG